MTVPINKVRGLGGTSDQMQPQLIKLEEQRCGSPAVSSSKAE